LKLALGWLLRDVDWSSVEFRQDCTWTPRLLTAVTLIWAWSDEPTLVERFASARRLGGYLFSPAGPLSETYQCFTKLLRRWTDVLMAALQAALRERLKQELSGQWCVLGFVMFGVDGSRSELPRTRSHEQAYSPTRKKRKKKSRHSRPRRDQASRRKANSPQLWLTTMWHVGAGLPWDWRIGPCDSSERAHMLDMLPQLPAEALITADAGFIGYQYLRAILASQRHLLIRVGSNVRLLKKLGYARRESDSTVYLWPDSQRDQPPLVLRLVEAHNGRHPVFLVTSVLSHGRLSDRQIVELYARRWGIELFYRHLKQTFGRRKLRSTSAENALLELHWSLAGLWGMALYALVQLQRESRSPRRLSIARTLRAFRRMIRDYLHPAEQGRSLRDRLSAALIDPYSRHNKASRNYPRKKQESPPGPPKVLLASRTQIELAQSLRRQLQQKG
jgi:hypothetical protein